MTAMCTYDGNDKNISVGTNAYYEEQASQEEIYLEETEEELRMILESDDPPPPRSENPDQQREHAAEELILGDSDDLPLSEETVEQMLRMTLIFRDLDEITFEFSEGKRIRLIPTTLICNAINYDHRDGRRTNIGNSFARSPKRRNRRT
jgi:hypothetical protein